MNAWVRRSLQASVIAGGFVVLGAGVANAAEPGQAADLGQTGQVQGLVGNVTGTAKKTVDEVTKQAPAAKQATKATTTKVTKKTVAKAPKATKVAPADDAATNVTREVSKASGSLLGHTPVVKKVHKAHTLPAPARHEAPRTELPAVQTLPAVDKVGVTDLLGDGPADAAADVTPNLDVTDTGVVADVVGTATGTVDETVPASIDLGDHGYADTVTDLYGTVDGMTHLTADDNGLYGITSISGVLDTASTLTAEVPGVASVFGSSSTFSTVDAVVEASGDLATGDLSGFGAVTGTLDSFNVLDVDAGDLGYLTTTASLSGWVDAIGEATTNLHSGDVEGFLAAAGTIDSVLTADGQVADIAGLSGVVTATALLDGFVAAAGNLYDGDLFATGSLFAALDATVDGYGWVAGVGDATLDAPISIVVDKTMDLLEVDL